MEDHVGPGRGYWLPEWKVEGRASRTRFAIESDWVIDSDACRVDAGNLTDLETAVVNRFGTVDRVLRGSGAQMAND